MRILFLFLSTTLVLAILFFSVIRFTTEGQIESLSSNEHIIGLHSHTHPTRMEEYSYAEQKTEYELNLKWIARLIGQKPVTMAHPCNSYNDNTIKILDELGIQLGFRSNTAAEQTNRFEWARIDHATLLSEFNMRTAELKK